MQQARRDVRTRPVLLRVLLVVAVVVGLCSMHVLAAAVSQHHAAVHETSRPTVVAAAADPAAGAAGGSSSSAGHAAASAARHRSSSRAEVPTFAGAAQAGVQAADDHHDHHGVLDCVLFLSAGIAVLLVLVAWAAHCALRRSYRLLPAWRRALLTLTPWRGPPPMRWPRTCLCVIRV
ncbi:hypothetical protein MN205_04790 [Kineococcus sp. TRM81007]|uniref:hypothetical protein n=1 Tax=Kineococcus sp. TRM81007 TaxID=2925831 RepID=UPI001F571FA8|nr:hypothetical protein [Kineococcus sp. TRM81007]MCI2237805.1 hypothetical protein [Kineococcus sp. TRM81007]